MNISASSRISFVLAAALAVAGCDSDKGRGSHTLSVFVSGSGTVTSVPAGINCSAAGGECSAAFESGSDVTLTATPGAASVFRTWVGSCTPATLAVCVVDMSQSRSEVAIFEASQASNLGEVFGITDSSPQNLVSFDRSAPGTMSTNVQIAGLLAGEQLVGIDFRPFNGALYALGKTSGSAGRIYILDRQTGAATFIATLAPDVTDPTNPYTVLTGTRFGLDFNPVTDRLRVVSDSGQDLRVNPDNGSTVTDPALNPGTPAVTAAAFTFSFPGATTTDLYVIDSGSDKLLVQNPQNEGTLTEVGALTVDATGVNGFDIIGSNVDALAALTVGGTPNLYTINLATGAATIVGALGSSAALTGLAVPTVSTPPETPGDAAVLTNTGRIITFDPVAPTIQRTRVQVTGLAADEQLVGIDFRALAGNLTSTLYGLSTASKLYTINLSTGAASLAAELSEPIAGTNFAMDFDPVADLLRVISDTGQNITVNPSSGAVVTETPVPVENIVTGIAYTNAFKGARTTLLYGIDAATDRLLTINPPSGGTTADAGALGINISALNGFDIDGRNGLALVAFNDSLQAPRLGVINLATGAITTSLAFAASESVRGLSIRAPGEPQAFAICEFSDNDEAEGGENPNPCVPGLTLYKFFISTSASYDVVAEEVSGLADGETVLDLDFRPVNGELVALGSTGKLYYINQETGAASLLSTLMPAVGDDAPFVSLDPALNYGMDFNPVLDFLRIVHRAVDADTVLQNENLRVAADTGVVITDGDLQRTPFEIPSIAFTNNAPNQSATVLYGLDTLGDKLFTIGLTPGPAGNQGNLTTIGSLGADATDLNGFEIIGTLNQAFAAWNADGTPTLYSINLVTGAATPIGAIGANSGFSSQITGMSATIGTTITELYAATVGANPVLVSFNPANPGLLTSSRNFSGLGASEQVLAMDFRPSGTPLNNNVLYVLTNAFKLYTVDESNAAATLVGPLVSSIDMAGAVPFIPEGTRFGLDFNPQNESLALTTNTGQFLSIQVNQAVPCVDTDPIPSPPCGVPVTENEPLERLPNPKVTALGYTQNFNGATTTRAFVMDPRGYGSSNDDRIMRLDPENLGYVEDVGAALGFDSSQDHFATIDVIGGHDGLALVTAYAPSLSNGAGYTDLYSFNLNTGAGSFIGTVGEAGLPLIVGDTKVFLRALALEFSN